MKLSLVVASACAVAALAAGCTSDPLAPAPTDGGAAVGGAVEEEAKPQIDKGTFDVYRIKGNGDKDPTYPVAYAWRPLGENPRHEHWMILVTAEPVKGFLRPGKDNDPVRLLFDYIPNPADSTKQWHHANADAFRAAMEMRYDQLVDALKPPRNGQDALLELESWDKQ